MIFRKCKNAQESYSDVGRYSISLFLEDNAKDQNAIFDKSVLKAKKRIKDRIMKERKRGMWFGVYRVENEIYTNYFHSQANKLHCFKVKNMLDLSRT